MPAVPNSSHPASDKKIGLAHWMDRALKEHSQFSADLATDLAHDLRVALRRCRVLASVMEEIDPTGDWQAMRKAARRLFRPMGELRDVQVLIQGAERVAAAVQLPAQPFLNELKARYEREIIAAQQAVQRFDRKQWREWRRKLAGHFRRVASDPAVCKAIALTRWNAVHRALRNLQRTRSRIAYHRLRIEIKKLRYTVENLLPSLYLGWHDDLKMLQDLLGEIHDRDVLASAVSRNRRFFDPSTHARWLQQLADERAQLLRQFQQKMTDNNSAIPAWREALPAGIEAKRAGLAQLYLWAYFIAPDLSGARQMARLALQLYDGAVNCGLLPSDPGFEARFVLHAAALLENVGRFKKGKRHHKASYRMIRSAPVPIGWTKKELALVACVARFHKGALPRPDHKVLRDYPAATRQSLIALASLLRLANAFRAKPYQAVRNLRIQANSGVLVVRADGYGASDPATSKLNAAKHLLEFAFQRPVSIIPSALPGPQLVRSLAQTAGAA